MDSINYSYFSFPKKEKIENEDSLLLPVTFGDSIFFAIADGVGGQKNGYFASNKIINLCKDILQKNEYISLKALFENIWIEYISFIEKNIKYIDAATTLTVCKISRKKLEIGHVGDCRVYTLYNSNIKQITNDHTLKNKLSQLSNEDIDIFDNVITSAFSYKSKYKIDLFNVNIFDKMNIFICSDGVYKTISTDMIHKMLSNSVPGKNPLGALRKELEHNYPGDDCSAIYVNLDGDACLL